MSGIEKFEPKNNVELTLYERKDSLVSVAPSGYDVVRAIKLAAKAIIQNPDLVKCTGASIQLAVINAVELGLDLSVSTGQAYIVQFGGRAQLIIGYRGWKKLVLDSGYISGIDAQVVYKNETCLIELGTDPKVTHTPGFDGGDIVGAYVVAVFKDGHRQVDVLRGEDIDRAKGASRTKGGPWSTDFPAMVRKTAVRRICKYLPETPLIYKAFQHDEPEATAASVRVEQEPGAHSLRAKLAEKPTAEPDAPPADASFVAEITGMMEKN